MVTMVSSMSTCAHGFLGSGKCIRLAIQACMLFSDPAFVLAWRDALYIRSGGGAVMSGGIIDQFDWNRGFEEKNKREIKLWSLLNTALQARLYR
jgi:hypothetical protein